MEEYERMASDVSKNTVSNSHLNVRTQNSLETSGKSVKKTFYNFLFNIFLFFIF